MGQEKEMKTEEQRKIESAAKTTHKKINQEKNGKSHEVNLKSAQVAITKEKNVKKIKEQVDKENKEKNEQMKEGLSKKEIESQAKLDKRKAEIKDTTEKSVKGARRVEQQTEKKEKDISKKTKEEKLTKETKA